MSHPARGAWIEIRSAADAVTGVSLSHPARGAWIEMFYMRAGACTRPGRTPHGVRGLKYTQGNYSTAVSEVSHPARGAWIEIKNNSSSNTN